jgi:hypothetical protein
MRPSVRFDVFKRDGFTCAYCGRKPPEVTLEVDHIIPRAEGGDDAVDNLTTACMDCNRGKGAGLLDDRAPVDVDLEQRAELIRERERQLRAYHDARREQVDREEAQITAVYEYWFHVWSETSVPHYYVPNDGTLRRYVNSLGPDEVMRCMDIARRKFYRLNTKPVRYLVGILKHREAEVEGRLTNCTICDKWNITDKPLEPGERWSHNACREEANA